MVITFDRAVENYEVTDVELERDHYLRLSQNHHLLAPQRNISQLRAFKIETLVIL